MKAVMTTVRHSTLVLILPYLKIFNEDDRKAGVL